MNTKFLVGVGMSVVLPASFAGVADHAAVPPTIVESIDPNVMINMSIERPMGGAAYNDQPGTMPNGSACGGRVDDGGTVGICYFKTEEYLGYFDPNKCYDYNSGSGYFIPNGATNSDHECSGQFSGNMLNWATLTAIDEFRWAMTGGNRIVDTATETVIKRARKTDSDNWFPVKLLNASHNVAPSTVTPWSDTAIYIYNTDFGVLFGTAHKGSEKATHNVRLKVCDSAQGLEDNCTAYGTSNKPEGLIQKNAGRMRFALMSYSADSDEGRDGGVLRANMKYVGPTRPAASGGTEANPNAEYSSVDGAFISNPDSVTLASGVGNSGVINYINQFAETQPYKSYDPISELFYECIRYFKNLGNTPEYSSGLTDAQKDGFPVLTIWDDPIQHSCQNNYIVGINDAHPWLDKTLPGTHFTSSPVNGTNLSGSDWGEPSNPDANINVTTLTNTVGALQGINGTSQCIGGGYTDFDASATNKTISALGEVMGTCPLPTKENAYYIAGLAYYANSQDIRSDFDGMQTITTFMIDTQEYAATPLTGQMNMLWLAGKYGGFEEINFNDTNSDSNTYEPDLAAEWDKDGDGEPDNYVFATAPQKLVSGLARAFTNIKERVNAGSAAAVVANSSSGAGAIYQALYEPSIVRSGKKVVWGGRLHALFIDDRGRLREDSNGNNRLDNYATDTVVELRHDGVSKTTKLYRYTNTTDGDTGTGTLSVHDLNEMNAIWEARDEMALLDNTTIGSQRAAYSTPAGSGRYIVTWIDSDSDGAVGNGEVIDFVASNFPLTNDNFRYLDVPAAAAGDLISFIRGKEGITGFRSRTIDYDNDGTDEAWRMGDIVHSSPVVVGKPTAAYDAIYGDSSYADFRNRYGNRRQMIYVGGNDGMLHAFNGGFWNSTTRGFVVNNGSDTAHPLGSELWAYVPMNLLPHLQWLTDHHYPHVYYVDGPPRVFDVNIFQDDADHPNGWGTILVVGMRLGGGPIDLDIDNDGTDETTTRSAYVILDITNPESPPTLLAEVTHADLGYTTSQPALIKARVPGAGNDWNNPIVNLWYLVFGSGPDDLSSAASSQTAKLYSYDLANEALLAGFDPLDLAETNSFVGDPASIDWDFDYVDDAVYFGIAGDASGTSGKLKRLKLSDSSVADLLAPNQPFVSSPISAVDDKGRRWIYAGSGRLFVNADNQSTAQQAFYGIRERVDSNGNPTWATVNVSDLADISEVQIFDDESIRNSDGSTVQIPTGTDVTTFGQLITAIDLNKDGWVRNFDHDGTNPSARNLNSAARIRSVLLYTDYTPSSNLCEPEGTSNLFALDFQTGTALSYAPLGTDSAIVFGGAEKAHERVSLGKGLSSTPIIHMGSSAPANTVNVFTQQSTGAITATEVALPPVTGGRESWRQIFDQ